MGHSWGDQTWSLDPRQLSVAWLKSMAQSPVSVQPNRCSLLGLLDAKHTEKDPESRRDLLRAGSTQRPWGHREAALMLKGRELGHRMGSSKNKSSDRPRSRSRWPEMPPHGDQLLQLLPWIG